MYLLTVVAKTNERNPEYQAIDDAYVSCWINRDTLEVATAAAYEMISATEWDVVGTEEVLEVSAADFEGDEESRRHYEQALTDGAVLVFHVSPRYPVYYLCFSLVPGDSDEPPSEARVWICNDAIAGEHDPFADDYWSGDRLEQAIRLATEAIGEQGIAVGAVKEQYRCSYDESSPDVRYFEGAEEDGICLVLVYE